MYYPNIKNQKSFNAIKRILEGDYKKFSVTKIKSDIDYCFADNYITNLKTVMEKSGIRFEEFMFLERFIPGEVVDLSPRIYLIASKNGAEEETSTLIKLVEQCPEGPILESVNAEFLQYGDGKKLYKGDWGMQEEFPKFLRNVKKEGKKVLVIDKGPVFYNREELKNISELFLAPIID